MYAQEDTWREPALAALERDYLSLVGQLSRVLHSRMLAEDLVNDAVAETLVKLRAHQVDDPSRLSGFVYGVAINLFKNHRRRLCNRTELQVDGELLDRLPCAEDPLSSHDRNEMAARLRLGIAALPIARDRELVRRFYLEEEDKASICADLGLTPEHFSRVVFRARRRLKALMQE